MKPLTILPLFLLVIGISTCSQSFGQNNFAVTWSPLSLYFGKLNLGAEYHIAKKQSLTFQVGVPTGTKRTFNSNNGNSDITSKATSIRAGFRLYTGKHAMSGFYFEPYLKYLHNTLDGTFNDTKNTPATLYSATSDYSAFGVGGQLGVQILIAKKIVLDLFLLGPEANTVKEDASFKDISNSIPWTPADAQNAQNNIQDAVNDIPIIGKKVVVTADQNSKTVFVTYKGFLPGIRSGFSVGFSF